MPQYASHMLASGCITVNAAILPLDPPEPLPCMAGRTQVPFHCIKAQVVAPIGPAMLLQSRVGRGVRPARDEIVGGAD